MQNTVEKYSLEVDSWLQTSRVNKGRTEFVANAFLRELAEELYLDIKEKNRKTLVNPSSLYDRVYPNKKITDVIYLECATFLFLAEKQILACYGSEIARNMNLLHRSAYNFLMTRNGDGVGFWDGSWGDQGDELTRIARLFPAIRLELYRNRFSLVRGW
jgi:hypothetical protein